MKQIPKTPNPGHKKTNVSTRRLTPVEKNVRAQEYIQKEFEIILKYHCEGKKEYTMSGEAYEYLSSDRIQWLKKRIKRMDSEDFLQLGQLLGHSIWNGFAPANQNVIRRHLGREFYLLYQAGYFPELSLDTMTSKCSTKYYVRSQIPIPARDTSRRSRPQRPPRTGKGTC